MREDIGLVAKAYGGTRANILRFAVPPRVAKVETEQRLAASFRRPVGGSLPDNTQGGFAGRGTNPDGTKLAGSTFAVASTVSEGAAQGYRRLTANYADVNVLHDALTGQRFQSFVFDSLPGAQEWQRNMAWMVATALSVAVLNAETMPAADRYRTYLAVALGQVKVVIGTRAVMYAPVEGPALFAILEDAAYQNMDGMMPYPQARGVMRLRAKSHGGVFVAMANARTPQSQWENTGPGTVETPVSGYSTAIHPLASPLKDATPWVRWLNRDELARLADPSIGARVPHTAVRVLSKALESGPVLLSIPQDNVSETLSCAKCHRQVRCAKCSGPLQLPADRRDSTPRCRWCGAAAINWKCPGCGHERMRVLDAWTSLYALGVDARLDTLTAWMRAMSLCAPRSRGGQALILGETDPAIAQSLMLWDSRILAAKDLEERVETGMPPAVAAACVWGRRDAVMTLMQRIGALGGDWTACGELPGMLGPVPIAQPDTVDARELEATADRVKAVIRVPQSRRAELAARLHRETARHVASREPGELRFRVDPKDLI